MKRLILSAFVILITTLLTTAQNVFPPSGNVGIGNASPSSQLEVYNGRIRVQTVFPANNYGDIFRVFDQDRSIFSINTFLANQNEYRTNIGINYSVNGGNGFQEYARLGNKYSPIIQFNADNGSISLFGENGGGNDFRTPSLKLGIFVEKSGIVGIGTSSPVAGYGLTVTTGILTEKVKIALASSSEWSDYVFAPSYSLKPLSEVEAYVKETKHLPGVPSAEELVTEGGINVNEMFARQMEKIEELTLYIIDINKRTEAQDKKIEILEKENAALKEKLKNQ